MPNAVVAQAFTVHEPDNRRRDNSKPHGASGMDSGRNRTRRHRTHRRLASHASRGRIVQAPPRRSSRRSVGGRISEYSSSRLPATLQKRCRTARSFDSNNRRYRSSRRLSAVDRDLETKRAVAIPTVSPRHRTPHLSESRRIRHGNNTRPPRPGRG